jgi:hypothetical protein
VAEIGVEGMSVPAHVPDSLVRDWKADQAHVDEMRQVVEGLLHTVQL